jgi:hypothetical protein
MPYFGVLLALFRILAKNMKKILKKEQVFGIDSRLISDCLLYEI